MAYRELVLSVKIIINDGEEDVPEQIQDLLNNHTTFIRTSVEQVSCEDIAAEDI